jgi:hypothetical protein
MIVTPARVNPNSSAISEREIPFPAKRIKSMAACLLKFLMLWLAGRK